MIWLLLLASLANAQEVSTGAATSLLDEVRISNLGKDTRDLLSGRYRQTGKPTFANGFCFADGTCQTTSASSSGFITEDSTNTWTGGNSFNNSVGWGPTTGSNDIGGGAFVYALSIDGAASLSSGCLVTLEYQSPSADSLLIFTSTNTGSVARRLGVTHEDSVPGGVYKIKVRGIARVASEGNVTLNGQVAQSATRCVAFDGGSVGTTSAGRWMQNHAGAQVGWIWLGQ